MNSSGNHGWHCPNKSCDVYRIYISDNSVDAIECYNRTLETLRYQVNDLKQKLSDTTFDKNITANVAAQLAQDYRDARRDRVPEELKMLVRQWRVLRDSHKPTYKIRDKIINFCIKNIF